MAYNYYSLAEVDEKCIRLKGMIDATKGTPIEVDIKKLYEKYERQRNILEQKANGENIVFYKGAYVRFGNDGKATILAGSRIAAKMNNSASKKAKDLWNASRKNGYFDNTGETLKDIHTTSANQAAELCSGSSIDANDAFGFKA